MFAFKAFALSRKSRTKLGVTVCYFVTFRHYFDSKHAKMHRLFGLAIIRTLLLLIPCSVFGLCFIMQYFHGYSTILSKIDENRCKQTLASSFWACRKSQFTVILNPSRITAYTVNSHALPTVYLFIRKKELPHYYETTISSGVCGFWIESKH